MSPTSRTRLAASFAAVLLLGAAGCSSDDDETPDDTTSTTTAAAAAPSTTAGDDGMTDDGMTDDAGAEDAGAEDADAEDAATGDDAGTIVDIAAGDADFATLVELVTAADLAGTLSGDGPFTVFAPTNDAFAAVPSDVLDALGADTEALAAVLTYHVVPGKVMAADLSDGQQVTTVQGTTFTVAVADDGAVSLTDATGQSIAVLSTDLEAGNGVIHVVGGVLLPGDPAVLLGG